jgi:hypothetical protein
MTNEESEAVSNLLAVQFPSYKNSTPFRTKSKMIVPSLLFLSSIVNALSWRPSLGEITVCGGNLNRHSSISSWPPIVLTQPCTGNAIQANWIAEPYEQEGMLVLCGKEELGDGTVIEHEACPQAPSQQNWFSGKVQSILNT